MLNFHSFKRTIQGRNFSVWLFAFETFLPNYSLNTINVNYLQFNYTNYMNVQIFVKIKVKQAPEFIKKITFYNKYLIWFFTSIINLSFEKWISWFICCFNFGQGYGYNVIYSSKVECNCCFFEIDALFTKLIQGNNT